MKKDLSASLLVVTYFILGVGAFVSTQETIRCLRCDHASSDDECGTITCDKLEECYTDEVITDQLTIVYNAGCRAKQRPRAIYNAPVTFVSKNKRSGFYLLHIESRPTSSEPTPQTDLIIEPSATAVIIEVRSNLIYQILGRVQHLIGVNLMRARVHDFLKRKGTERLDWPALSPDVIPTERMWNELKVCYATQTDFNGHNTFFYGCLSKLQCQFLMQNAYNDFKLCVANLTQPPSGMTRAQACIMKEKSSICHACCADERCNYGSCESILERIFVLALDGAFNMTTLKTGTAQRRRRNCL
ncbi:uncharacterized protein LOC132725920 isoform X1 [Ruditapes philippinarum]|uniref:uncharacterized protein LOC132725920 isoform X1 n=1 Tax=Ruditapes philippinarum TaxID=129788 RepID=UPI00295A917C|nr:uncharacterized protein LOC132725920 isoform X1 [Ruditapes philippinarum]